MSFPEFSTESDFDFHLTNIKGLLEDTNYLKHIPNFPLSNPDHFYSRKDKQGWWMATKQIIIKHYIEEYLTILGRNKRRFIQLYFIDLLSSYGMNKITKSRGEEVFIFPGSSISAALISSEKKIGFKKIYANDLKLNERVVLKQRLNALNDFNNNNFEVKVNDNEPNIDSNQWVLHILKEIKNEDKTFNYLMIIDNDGMNINYETLKSVREIHNYGDIIITFQDAGINRNLKPNPKVVKEFFGIEIPPNTKKENLCEIYIKQLNKIGLNNIETINITSQGGFYYTLLFCCRGDIEAKWLRMIDYYRNERFKKWNDSDVKKMWDVAKGKVTPLDKYF